MSGRSLFIDTNIVLYLLAGDEDAKELLDERPVFVSFITELELLRHTPSNQTEEQNIHAFLDSVTIIDINSSIKQIAAELGRRYKVKLPDLIVAASTYYLNLPLLTADKQLGQIEEIEVLLFDR
jgi:predicted nucleic acid-binding protein